MKGMFLKHLQSLLLPVTVLLVIPGIIIYFTRDLTSFWGLHSFNCFIQLTIGITQILTGLFLLAMTIRMFIQIGKGTLAPWNPTRKLVVSGIYRYTRNPMITGVLFVLLGESILLGSFIIFLWFIIFFVVNTVYFLLFEEPGLEKRFGNEYLEYKKNVPRWIPGFTPWERESER